MAQDNPAQRMEEQQQNLQHHRETRSDPECWAQQQDTSNMSRQQCTVVDKLALGL